MTDLTSQQASKAHSLSWTTLWSPQAVPATLVGQQTLESSVHTQIFGCLHWISKSCLETHLLQVNRSRKSGTASNNTGALLPACSASSKYWDDGEGLHQTHRAFPLICKIKTVAEGQISGLGFYWPPRQPWWLTQVSERCEKSAFPPFMSHQDMSRDRELHLSCGYREH